MEERNALSCNIILMIEEAQLNGPDVHPVFRYLQKLFNVLDLETLFPTFIFGEFRG